MGTHPTLKKQVGLALRCIHILSSPDTDHPESMDRIGVQWPHQSRRPPTKAAVEIEDAMAQNCLVLLTLCKAASIYAATGSHRQWRLNSCGLIPVSELAT